MAEPQVGRNRSALHGPVGAREEILQQRLGVILRKTPVERRGTADHVILIVVVHVQPVKLVGGKEVVKRNSQTDVLHVGGEIEKALHQLLRVDRPHELPVGEQLRHQPVGTHEPIPDPLVLLQPTALVDEVEVLPAERRVGRLAVEIEVARRPAARRARHLQTGIKLLEPLAESRHAQHAPHHEGRLRIDDRAGAEYFGEIAVHARGDLPVLLGAERRKIAAPVDAVVVDALHPAVDLASPLGKGVRGVGGPENGHHLVVFAVVQQPARTVPAVMTDIKRFITLRRRRQHGIVVGVDIIYAAGLAGICSYFVPEVLSRSGQRREGAENGCE